MLLYFLKCPESLSFLLYISFTTFINFLQVFLTTTNFLSHSFIPLYLSFLFHSRILVSFTCQSILPPSIRFSFLQIPASFNVSISLSFLSRSFFFKFFAILFLFVLLLLKLLFLLRNISQQLFLFRLLFLLLLLLLLLLRIIFAETFFYITSATS